MKETLHAVRQGSGAPGRQYEYLILTVRPDESVPVAYQRLREHAEYGKWELERSRLYMGGGRQYWMRRRVLRVERTLDVF
ncbi:hypothetical protein AL755_11750 [Arthrobacter sp. ERGS1:01]|uniref:DUF5703 family protein n=1 Tax=Arthrobacter sp. ERGS1:01 TaxID=1704044 RepID=UPI0006B5161C|nr:DUF5703 family protein [Arthrobacter sp. ERGS1:01]ALE05987.1 hypothetical protein AL755_11750 [Arthrobacter sp. ERGS1:01]